MDDIHKSKKALKYGLRGLAVDKRIQESEKALILEFIKALESKGLYAGRRAPEPMLRLYFIHAQKPLTSGYGLEL